MTNQQTDIEKTLKRILARELKEWPSGTEDIAQGTSGKLYDQSSNVVGFIKEIAADRNFALVTRADWEAERALIADEKAFKDAISKIPGEGKGWVDAGNMYLQADIDEAFKRGVQSVLDDDFQALWDKVAIIGLKDALSARLPREDLMRCVMNMADDFMAERAKRIAARKANHD